PRNKLNRRNLPGLDGPLEPKLLTDRSVTNYATGSSAVSHAVTTSKRQSKHRWKRRKDARPGEIVAAALEVFGERGFAATKLADVARRAGVTKGTVYLYFDSKEALFKAVVRETIVPVIAKGEAFAMTGDRKSTRLNSSHRTISYAVFCLKKKKKYTTNRQNKHHIPYKKAPL